MAKALVNKGIPIKADNPKDPYIRDENGIKDIANSSTVFGKTLGTSDGKIQLKNGNTVLSEVSVPAPAPDLSAYGKTLGLGGRDLSLKNGNTILSTVTLPTPDLSTYGQTLAISGQDLSLKNGNTVLSTVTIPSGGGGSSAGVSTYTATFNTYWNSYRLDSAAVATEIYGKLNNNEDVQIVLAKDGNKYIARCVGYYKGEMEGEEYIEDPCYYFTAVINDLPRGELIAITFDLHSGSASLAITDTVISNNV